MRIISKSNDYYDSVQALGLDKDLVFVRKEECLSGDDALKVLFGNQKCGSFTEEILNALLPGGIPKSRYGFGRVRWDALDNRVGFFIVGFCGDFFPCVRVAHPSDLDLPGKKSLCFYKGDEIDIPESFRKSLYRVEKNDVLSAQRKIGRFLNLEFKSNHEWFHKFQSPVIVLEVTDCYRSKGNVPVLTLNAVLADYKFYRVKDAFTAFQDIGQFLGGVLGDTNDLGCSISDQDMRDAKGFDDWSFKRRPSKRR